MTEENLEPNICNNEDSSPCNEEDKFEFLDYDYSYLQTQPYADIHYLDYKEILNRVKSNNQSNIPFNITEFVDSDKQNLG